MLKLAICETFNKSIHGITLNTSKDIEGQYLIESIDLEDFYSGDYKKFRLGKGIEDANYKVQLEIVEEHTLEGGETVGVIKTCALKRLQRRWRKYVTN